MHKLWLHFGGPGGTGKSKYAMRTSYEKKPGWYPLPPVRPGSGPSLPQQTLSSHAQDSPKQRVKEYLAYHGEAGECYLEARDPKNAGDNYLIAEQYGAAGCVYLEGEHFGQLAEVITRHGRVIKIQDGDGLLERLTTAARMHYSKVYLHTRLVSRYV